MDDRGDWRTRPDRWLPIGVQGPQARAVLDGRGALPCRELEPLAKLASLTWRGVEITLVRAEAWKGEAYEDWLAPEKPGCSDRSVATIWRGACGFSGAAALRMAAGFRCLAKTSASGICRRKLGQERALHFAKRLLCGPGRLWSVSAPAGRCIAYFQV